MLGGDPAGVTTLSHRSKLRNNEGRSLHQYHDCLVLKAGQEGRPLEAKFSNFKSITLSMTHFLSIMPNTRGIRISYIFVLYLHLGLLSQEISFPMIYSFITLFSLPSEESLKVFPGLLCSLIPLNVIRLTSFSFDKVHICCSDCKSFFLPLSPSSNLTPFLQPLNYHSIYPTHKP